MNNRENLNKINKLLDITLDSNKREHERLEAFNKIKKILNDNEMIFIDIIHNNDKNDMVNII